MPRATIGDVANLAAVSKKTVSRVLNNESGVTPFTQDKVRRAIAALNFQPDLSARRLRKGQSYLLALLYPDAGRADSIYADPYVSALLRGALHACDNHQYDLLLRPVSAQPAPLLAFVKDFIHRTQVDGLVLAPPACDDMSLLNYLKSEEIPFVCIAPKHHSDCAAIVADDIAATANGIHYVISQGHSAIAMVNPLLSHGAGIWRKQGFLNAIQHHQLHLPTHYLVESTGDQVEPDIRALLRGKTPPTAIFATNDSYAALVYKVAYQLGLKVPHHLSILGFDDSPLASLLSPGLSSIKQPVQEMAESAVSLIIKLINQEHTPTLILHKCALSIRNSISKIA